MSDFYFTNSISEEESIEIIGEALKQGVNLFDTAAVYGNGKNEILLGKAIKKYGREKFIVSTKVPIFIPGTQPPKTCGTKDYVKKSCYESLERLGIVCIDLYF